MKLHIKYMVSNCCKTMVKEALTQVGLTATAITLGEVDLREDVPPETLRQLRVLLIKSGHELMDDKRAILIERIKNVVIEIVHYADEASKINFSAHLGDTLGYDYTYLANLFSETTGITIEHFMILHKIERAKELIIYDELNMTEIAHKLNYSSASHLSNQFKKITGLTPSFFKSLNNKKRISLEDVGKEEILEHLHTAK